MSSKLRKYEIPKIHPLSKLIYLMSMQLDGGKLMQAAGTFRSMKGTTLLTILGWGGRFTTTASRGTAGRELCSAKTSRMLAGVRISWPSTLASVSRKSMATSIKTVCSQHMTSMFCSTTSLRSLCRI